MVIRTISVPVEIHLLGAPKGGDVQIISRGVDPKRQRALLAGLRGKSPAPEADTPTQAAYTELELLVGVGNPGDPDAIVDVGGLFEKIVDAIILAEEQSHAN